MHGSGLTSGKALLMWVEAADQKGVIEEIMMRHGFGAGAGAGAVLWVCGYVCVVIEQIQGGSEDIHSLSSCDDDVCGCVCVVLRGRTNFFSSWSFANAGHSLVA